MAHFYPVVANNEKDLKDYAQKRVVIILDSSDVDISENVKQAKSNRRKSNFFNVCTDAMVIGGVGFLPLIPIAIGLKFGNHILKKFYSGSDKHLLDNYKVSQLPDGRIMLINSRIFKSKKDTVDGINGKETPAKYTAHFTGGADDFIRRIKAKEDFCIIAKSKVFDEVEKLIKSDSSFIRDKQLVKRNGYKIIFDYTQKVVFAVKEEFDADREKINTSEINQKVFLRF